MPFTFSHPAIVLPFLRVKYKGVSMSAMVIGAIAPDFEYFLRMNLDGRFSHTAMGIFLLDIPLGAAIFFLFHQVIKHPLIDNMPGYFRCRLQELRRFNALSYWSDYYIPFLVCLGGGAASHLFLDSLTHERDLIVQQFAFFRQRVTLSGLPEYPTYKYVYYVTTLVGALVIIIVFHFTRREPVEQASGIWKFWSVMTALGVAFWFLTTSAEFQYFGSMVVTVIGAAFWSVVITSIGYRLFNGQKENVGTGR